MSHRGVSGWLSRQAVETDGPIRGMPVPTELRIVMRRRELPWWVAVIIALSLLLLWVGSCEDWSWLPNAPYDANS